MTPEQRAKALRDGEQAAAFYSEHPFEAARLQILQEWSLSRESAAREALWSELQALNRIVNILRIAGQNAKMAALEIKAEEAAATGEVDPYAHA